MMNKYGLYKLLSIRNQWKDIYLLDIEIGWPVDSSTFNHKSPTTFIFLSSAVTNGIGRYTIMLDRWPTTNPVFPAMAPWTAARGS